MKKTLLGVALALTMAVPAFASDPMASRYGNTLVISDASGKELQRIYFNEDKTLTVKTAQGEMKGTWELKDGKLCITQTEPAPADATKATTCNPFSGEKKVGDSWTVTGQDGAPVTITLVAGRP